MLLNVVYIYYRLSYSDLTAHVSLILASLSPYSSKTEYSCEQPKA